MTSRPQTDGGNRPPVVPASAGSNRLRAALLPTCLLAAFVGTALAAESPPDMTFDEALQQLKVYDDGQDDKPLRAIELQAVRQATDAAARADVAARLGTILAAPDATHAAKVFVCQQLAVFGTAGQVPLLARMLDDPQTAEIARWTLDAIPGEAASAALRRALTRLTGPALIGAVNSLGLRRDGPSVAPLTALLAHADPGVAAAAAEALGKIATVDAAAALQAATVAPQAATYWHNARLQCAERRAAEGDMATAGKIYEAIWASDAPPARRVGGLAGLANVAPDQAVPLVLKTLADDDALLQATAMQLAGRLPGGAMTQALVERLPQLEPAGQVLLLDALAQRGDRAAAAAVAERTASEHEAVRTAAVTALARVGDASQLKRLVELAAAGGGPVSRAAQTALAKIAGADIEPELLKMAADGDVAARTTVFRVLASRRASAATPLLLRAAAESDEPLRRAAFEALAAVAGGDSYGQLVDLLVAAATPGDVQAAERAVLETGSRLSAAPLRMAPVLAALDTASDQAKPALIRVLGGIGGVEALGAVRAQWGAADTAVRDAVVRTLAGWTEPAAAPDLLKLAQTADEATHRVLAMRGYLRLAGEIQDAAARLQMLEDIRPVAIDPQAKRLLLATLAEAADPGALQVAAEFLGDDAVQTEAEVAALKIARALVRSDPPSVRAAMRKLMDTTRDEQVAGHAAALDEEAMNAPPPDAAEKALQQDRARSDAIKGVLAKRAPRGYRLAGYLDCGPDRADGAKDGPLLRLVGGAAYFWPGSEQQADVRFGSVFYDGGRVIFEAAGMDPRKVYQLGFTWWDFDHATRAQSVILATGKGENETRVLEKTKLPSGANQQSPEEKTLPVPAELYGDGRLRITFRNEAQPNAVVSELWLWESEADR
jgi:HEAT repeat protein